MALFARNDASFLIGPARTLFVSRTRSARIRYEKEDSLSWPWFVRQRPRERVKEIEGRWAEFQMKL